MDPLDPFLGFWRALDALFEGAAETPWGGVVADARFPAVQEANYARVEATAPVRLAEVEADLRPALERSGAGREHVVVFRPEAQTRLLTEASTRGDRLVWDLVMVHAAKAGRGNVSAPVARTDGVEEVRRFDPAFWSAHRASTRLFDVTDEAMLDQLQTIERDVLVPAGRRWFVVRDDADAPVAFAALLVLREEAFVDHVVTLPHTRRRGHATALTRRLLAEAGAAGAGRTYLLAEPRGVAADLYAGLGFAPVTQIVSWIAPLGRPPAG